MFSGRYDGDPLLAGGGSWQPLTKKGEGNFLFGPIPASFNLVSSFSHSNYSFNFNNIN